MNGFSSKHDCEAVRFIAPSSGVTASEPNSFDKTQESDKHGGDVGLPPQVVLTSRSRFTSFGNESHEFRWEQISMTVALRRRNPLHILRGVTGSAKSGQLTCILGPSGSGKTTLLNVIAGRQSTCQDQGIQISGQVWLSGQRVDPRAVRHRIAYVMQKDELFATATPREALHFSASLRLVGPQEHGDGLISELLGSLGLLPCADTLIGNAVINGLSGGQRKRTAIGIELITRPDIVCLDEPTSGLDAYAAYQVVRVLKDLAIAGCTVICTLHQPSSEIFALADHVICLCAGQCFFEGDRGQMMQYLDKVGYKCPAGFNPADFIIFLMQTENRERIQAILRQWTHARLLEVHRLSAATTGIRDSGRQSPFELNQTHRRGARRISGASQITQRTFGKQLLELSRRELRATFRDTTTMAVRFCLSVLLAFLFSLVFRGVGRIVVEKEQQTAFDLLWTGLTEDEVRALRKQKLEWHFNALVQVAMVAMFGACQPVVLTFPLERSVFLREYNSGTYDVLPYYFSKMLVEVPLVVVQSLLTLGLCYTVMSLNGDFCCLLLAMVLLSVCSVAVSLAISCAVRQPRETGAIGPLIFVPQMLFSGVFVPVSRFPSYMRWMQYFSFLQYAIKVLGVVEFRFVPDKEMLLESQDIDESHLLHYVCLLVSLVLFFMWFGIAMLRRKAKHIF